MSARATVETVNTAPGLAHAQYCLPRMAKLATEGAHDWNVHQLACRITREVPSKDSRGELGAIYKWVRDNIRYRKDPVGNNIAGQPLELVQSPLATLRCGAGDCAAMTTLIGALAQTLGHATKFRTVGPSPNAQAHVQALAWDDREWVHMDPVLEPRQRTTAPRRDLGKFGRFAPGADHYWNQGGVQMSGIGFVPTEQQKRLWSRTLGFVPSAQQRKTWKPTPFERIQRNPQLAGLQRVSRAQLGSLGEGWTIGKQRVTTDDAKALASYLKAKSNFLSKSSKEKQGALEAEFYANQARIASDPKYAGTQWARISHNNRNWIKDHYGPTHSILHNVVQAGKTLTKSTAGKVAAVAGGVVLAPLLPAISAAAPGIAISATKPLRPLRDAVLKAVPLPGVMQAVHAEDAIIDAIKKGNGSSLVKVAKSALPMLSKAAAKIVNLPGVKRALDKTTGKFVYYTTADISKQGGKRALDKLTGRTVWYTLAGPTISFSLGDVAGAKAAAQAAVNSVATFIKQNGQPPQMKLPAVGKFQAADGSLKVDNLWGNNSRAAAAYYLGKPVSALPAVAKPWAGNAVTWRPPTAAAPKPVAVKVTPAPAPKPVAPKPSAGTAWNRTPQLVSLANAAVNAINAFRKSHKNVSPAVKVAQVDAYQGARNTAAKSAGVASITRDALYGPTTQSEMAKTLGVSPGALPPYYSGIVKKPAAKTAAAPQPAPTPIVELVPAPTPVVVTKPDGSTAIAVPVPKPVIKASDAKPKKKKSTAKPLVVTKPDGSTAIAVPINNQPPVPDDMTDTALDQTDQAMDDSFNAWYRQQTNDKKTPMWVWVGLYWLWLRNSRGTHHRAAA